MLTVNATGYGDVWLKNLVCVSLIFDSQVHDSEMKNTASDVHTLDKKPVPQA